MSEITMKEDFHKEEESNGIFSFQTIWALFCQNWYWVLISVIVCVGVVGAVILSRSPMKLNKWK